MAKATMANRDLAFLDRTASEGDVEASDEVIAEILRAGSEVDPDWLSERATATAMTDPARQGAIPSDVEALLNGNGITLPRGHPDRRALALAMLRSRVDAFRIVGARLAGEAIETPERPARLETAPVETGPPCRKRGRGGSNSTVRDPRPSTTTGSTSGASSRCSATCR